MTIRCAKMMVIFVTFLLQVCFEGRMFAGSIERQSDLNLRTVNLATTNWPPYYGEDLPNGGPLVEISKEAFLRRHYHLKVQFFPWKRAISMVREGKFAGLLGAYKNRERSQYLIFSDPIAIDTLVFASLASKKLSFDSYESLKHYRIGVTEGYIHSAKFDEVDFLLKEATPSSRLNLKKLLSGRIDLMVESRTVISYYLERFFQKDSDRVIYLKPAIADMHVFNAFSKNNGATEGLFLAEEFNKGLREIVRDGTFGEIITRHGLDLSRQQDLWKRENLE